MKNHFLTLVILTGLIILTGYRSYGQDETDCSDFQFSPQPITDLPGTLVVLDDGVQLLNLSSATLSRHTIPGEYRYETVSTDGRWLITSPLIRNEASELIRIEYWMHDMQGIEEPKFLLSKPAPPTFSRTRWLDDETLEIHVSSEGGPRRILLKPFDTPIEYLELETYVDDWSISSTSSHGRYHLLWRDFQNSIYDIQTTTHIHDLGRITFPQWLSDGRVVYVADTGTDENAASAVYNDYAELFVYDVTEDSTTQISHFEDSYGVVDINRQLTSSPDGRYIGFKMRRFDLPDYTIREVIDNVPLYLADLETGAIDSLCIVPEDSEQEHFFWSPDSQYIGFTYEDNLVVVNVETRIFSIVEEDIVYIIDWQ